MAIIWVLKLTLGAIAAAIAPRVSLSTQIIANGNNWLATVTGSTNDYFELGNWKFEIGRAFQEDETISGSRVATRDPEIVSSSWNALPISNFQFPNSK